MMNLSKEIEEKIAKEFSFDFSRSSGPGGQNVNKVNSKVHAKWMIYECKHLPADVLERLVKRFAKHITHDGELIVASDRFRDQPRNIEDCCEKLLAMIDSVWRAPKKRIASKPTAKSRAARLKSKSVRSEIKAGRRRVKSQNGDE